MALKEITLANFYAGISESNYYGVEKGQFRYARNVDVQSEVRGMRLIAEQQLDPNVSAFSGGDCVLMQRLEDWFPNYSGWIHVSEDQLFLDGNFVASLSPGVKGWAPYFSGSTPYVYIFSASKVDQYQVGGVVTLATATFAVNSLGYRPWVQRAGDVLFGAGDKLYQISGVGMATTIVPLIDFLFKEEITALTRFSSEYKIYTKTGLEGGGKQFIWDGVSDSVSAVVTWDNSAPISAISNGAYDYVLAGRNEEFTDLYIATGNDRRIVKSGAVGGKGRTFLPRMKMCKDILYIMGSIDVTAKNETADRKPCIFSYGSENAGFPNGLQIETVFADLANQEFAFSNIYPTEDWLYYVQATTGVTSNKQYRINKRRNIATNYIANGEWISNTITGGVIWTVKNFRQLSIGYSLDPIEGYGGSIEVYMRNKKYGAWTLIKTITDASSKFAKVYENEISSNINVWNECEIRFVLISGDSNTKTPFIYEATLIYEDNLKA